MTKTESQIMLSLLLNARNNEAALGHNRIYSCAVAVLFHTQQCSAHKLFKLFIA
jgi:hypothetical protein